MKKTDLDELSLKELKQLEKDVSKAIGSFEARQKNEALAAVEATLRKMGFSLAELTGGAKTQKKMTAAVAKYQHPENTALTWAGRGRKPDWFNEAVEAGMPKEDMLIK